MTVAADLALLLLFLGTLVRGQITSPCTWHERVQITAEDPEPKCTAKCYTMCNLYPSEYMCFGKTIFIDDDDKRIDDTTNNLYTYCLCQLSKVTRMTGELCGHAQDTSCVPPMDPETTILDVIAPHYVGGWNTFIEGT